MQSVIGRLVTLLHEPVFGPELGSVLRIVN